MSRRCRDSLQERASQGSAAGDETFSSGCDCGRLGGKVVVPCTEPIVYGANILKDPSFEQHSALIPKGPGTDDFPDGLTFPGDGFSIGGNTGPLFWHTEAIGPGIYYDQNGWGVWSNNVGFADFFTPGTDPSPFISDLNPRTGTFHWRVSYVEEEDWTGAETYPIPVGGRYCNVLLGGFVQGFTTRCAPGDLVVASFYAMVNTTADGPYPAYPNIGFFDVGALHLDDLNLGTGPDLTTSYQKIEAAMFAPPEAYALVVEYVIENGAEVTTGNGPLHFDVDDCSVSLLQAGISIILCAQTNLITIDNDTTETSFL